jgi:hypothetical protein
MALAQQRHRTSVIPSIVRSSGRQREIRARRPDPPRTSTKSRRSRSSVRRSGRLDPNHFLDPYAPLYNPDHQHLEFATLGVLWTNKSYRKQQRWILGQAEDPKGNTGGAWKKGQREQQLEQWFGGVPDFVITLYAPR